MQNSTIVFLINDDARALSGKYEDGAKSAVFKTLDPEIQVGDLVVVESSTRHEMTVVKIDETDLDINFDTATDVKWIVQRVETERFKEVLEQEKQAIAAVQAAERRRKKEDLRKSLFADHQDKIQALELSKTEIDEVLE